MDALHVTLLILLVLAALAVLRLLAERNRLTVERDLARARLDDTEEMRGNFQALAGEALRTSNAQFLDLARQTLAAGEKDVEKELDEKRKAFDDLLKPITRVLQETQHQLRRSEKDRAGLSEQVQRMTKSNRALRAETTKLVQALAKPNVRGRYGEIQLQRVVELAGMRSYCDFTPQESLRDPEGRVRRPDMVVRLPNGRVVAVDSKVSLDSYLEAMGTEDAEERERLLDRYGRNVRDQLKKLASKEYWATFEDSPELVVLFLPGDQLVDAALEQRPDLIELAARENVVIASPSTLIGLLRAVHVGWRERNLTENAEELFRLGRELHGRAATVIDHATRVGDCLDQARKSYNAFVGSVSSRLVPTLRKFEERDARSTKAVEAPRELEEAPRTMNADELFGLEPSPADELRPVPRPADPAPPSAKKDSDVPEAS